MRRLIFLFIAFLTLSADLVEYTYFQKDDTQAKMKAIFLYNFTKNFEWPTNNGNFVITIVGDNPSLISMLNKTILGKKVGEQSIEIKNFQTVKEVDKAHILYITTDRSSLLNDAVSKFKGKGTLIITEKQGLAKVGATINFVVADNKQQFELNKAAASKAGLVIGSKIEKSAIAVFN